MRFDWHSHSRYAATVVPGTSVQTFHPCPRRMLQRGGVLEPPGPGCIAHVFQSMGRFNMQDPLVAWLVLINAIEWMAV